ncbi:hypothetical protein ACQ5SK_29590 [Bradyrhizobium japonicum]
MPTYGISCGIAPAALVGFTTLRRQSDIHMRNSERADPWLKTNTVSARLRRRRLDEPSVCTCVAPKGETPAAAPQEMLRIFETITSEHDVGLFRRFEIMRYRHVKRGIPIRT